MFVSLVCRSYKCLSFRGDSSGNTVIVLFFREFRIIC